MVSKQPRFLLRKHCPKAAEQERVLPFWLIAAFLLLAGTPTARAQAADPPAPIEASLIQSASADPYAPGVARIVHAMAEYSRWPHDKRQLTLCLIKPASHARDIAATPLSRGRSLNTIAVPPHPAALENCDALYMGQLAIVEQRALTDSVRDRAVLTIAEADPGCRSRAMVCLVYQPNGPSFQLNIDAVSRSSVAIDPRVLRMAARPEDRP